MFYKSISLCFRSTIFYLFASWGGNALASDSLCLTGETQTFNCSMGDKILSICEKDSEQFSYRYGTQDNIELHISSVLNFSTNGFSGGYESRLTFNNGDYDYVVFTAMYSRGPTNPDKDMQSGVLIAKDGVRIQRKRCVEPIHSGFQLSPIASEVHSDVEGNQQRFVEY